SDVCSSDLTVSRCLTTAERKEGDDDERKKDEGSDRGAANGPQAGARTPQAAAPREAGGAGRGRHQGAQDAGDPPPGRGDRDRRGGPDEGRQADAQSPLALRPSRKARADRLAGPRALRLLT